MAVSDLTSSKFCRIGENYLTLWELVYDIFVLRFWPKKQQQQQQQQT